MHIRNLHLWGIGWALCLSLVFSACKKDDPIDPNGNTTSPETALSFTCKDTTGISGILVGIAPLESDRDAGYFLKSGQTDGLGKIKFSGLQGGTVYYYSAARTTNNGVVKRTGSATAEQDKKVSVTVNF